MRRGFTIVELVITITIMGILLTLAVVNLNSTQVNARDSERKGDAESLALNIENFYTNQNATIASSGGTYPGTSQLTDANIRLTLPDLDMKNAHAPGIDESAPITLQAATSAEPSALTIQPRPAQANDIYVYQPLTANGTICTDPAVSGDCRRFNLYYYNEAHNTVEMIVSKHQS